MTPGEIFLSIPEQDLLDLLPAATPTLVLRGETTAVGAPSPAAADGTTPAAATAASGPSASSAISATARAGAAPTVSAA